jgi:hypothetical protein
MFWLEAIFIIALIELKLTVFDKIKNPFLICIEQRSYYFLTLVIKLSQRHMLC